MLNVYRPAQNREAVAVGTTYHCRAGSWATGVFGNSSGTTTELFSRVLSSQARRRERRRRGRCEGDWRLRRPAGRAGPARKDCGGVSPSASSSACRTPPSFASFAAFIARPDGTPSGAASDEPGAIAASRSRRSAASACWPLVAQSPREHQRVAPPAACRRRRTRSRAWSSGSGGRAIPRSSPTRRRPRRAGSGRLWRAASARAAAAQTRPARLRGSGRSAPSAVSPRSGR